MGLDLLKLAGEFARADQQSKADRIAEAGQDIAEKKAFYSAQALNEFGIARDNFAKKEEKYRNIDTQLRSLGTDATKEDIGTALAKAELGSVEFAKLDDEKQKRVIESYYGNIEAYDRDGNLVGLNSDVEGKKYRVSGNYNPAPKVPKLEDYYNDDMFMKAEEDIRNNVKGEWTDFINRIRGKDQRTRRDDDGTERKISASEDILFKLQNDVEKGYEKARTEAINLGALEENPYEFSALESAKAASNFSQFVKTPPKYVFDEDSEYAKMFPELSNKKEPYNNFRNDFLDYQAVNDRQVSFFNKIVANTLPKNLIEGMFEIDSQTKKRVLTPFGEKLLADIRPIVTANATDMLGQLSMLANSNNEEQVAYSIQNFDSFISEGNLTDSVTNELSARLLTFTDEKFKFYFDSVERPYIIGRNVANNSELAIIEETVGLDVFKKALDKKLTDVFNANQTFSEAADLNTRRKAIDNVIRQEIIKYVGDKKIKESEVVTNNFVPTITDDAITYIHTDQSTGISEVKAINVSQIENFDSELKQKFKQMNPESFKLYEEYQLNKKEQATRKPVETQVEDLFSGNISVNNFLEFAPPFKKNIAGRPDYSKHNVGNSKTKLTQEFIDWSNSDGAQAWIDFIQNYEEPVQANYETFEEFQEARREYNSSGIANFKGKNLKKLNQVIERRNQVLGTE